MDTFDVNLEVLEVIEDVTVAFTLLTFALGLLALLSLVYSTLRHGIGPTPTSRRVAEAVHLLLPPLPNGSLIIELGAGWGNMTRLLANRYPNCHIVAYENSFIPWLFCRLVMSWHKVENVEIKKKNFWVSSFEGASLIFCYLYRAAMPCLWQKCAKELKPSTGKCSTWLISHTFAFAEAKPDQHVLAKDVYHTPVYLYKL